MNKLTIGHFIYFVFILQLLFLVGRFYKFTDSWFITLLPTILFSIIFFIVIFAVLVFYKYIKKGRGKWFGSDS